VIHQAVKKGRIFDLNLPAIQLFDDIRRKKGQDLSNGSMGFGVHS